VAGALLSYPSGMQVPSLSHVGPLLLWHQALTVIPDRRQLSCQAGWPVSIDDVSLLGHVIADQIVHVGFGSDGERSVGSERNGGRIG
jgi:hypothetical protein